MTRDGDYLDGYGEGRRGTGFRVAPGRHGVTEGINFWKKLYIIDNPVVRGGKMGVLLMDTQGLWDSTASNQMNYSIYGLSCILSSYLIINFKGVVETIQLTTMSTQTQFSRDLQESITGTPFQHLDILIRDSPDIDAKNGTMADVERVNGELLREMTESPELIQSVREIQHCFDRFDVHCLPNPGVIDTVGYDGNIGSINRPFLIALGHYIEDISMKLQPRKLDDEILNGFMFME